MATVETCSPELTTADIAKQRDNHPSAAIRWITRGACLRNGNRIKLRAIRTPGGWRVRQEWLDEFLAVLTNDRQEPDSVLVGERTRRGLSLMRRAQLDRVDRALAAEGY
jgi:hypothetical protein